MPSVWSWVYEKVVIRVIINGGWDSFYDQSIEHKINKHPVMTVINDDGTQLMGMSEEENMTVRRVHGAPAYTLAFVCTHTRIHTHRHTQTHVYTQLPSPSPALAGRFEFHQGVLRRSHLRSFALGI